jgi:hypothetical protein
VSDEARISINGSFIHHNHVQGDGGGVLSSGMSDVAVRDTLFFRNEAPIKGGGVASVEFSVLSLDRCNVSYVTTPTSDRIYRSLFGSAAQTMLERAAACTVSSTSPF